MSFAFVMSCVRAATMDPDGDRPCGPIRDAVIVIADGRIDCLGPAAELPAGHAGRDHRRFAGRLVTLALVDGHTHVAPQGADAYIAAAGAADPELSV